MNFIEDIDIFKLKMVKNWKLKNARVFELNKKDTDN